MTAGRSRTRWVGGIYALLLALSFGVRATTPTLESDGPGLTVAPSLGGPPAASPGVRIAYSDFGDARSETPPVVLLHGSPGTRRELSRVGEALSARRRVIVPDLPGFGGSTRSLPDYSIRAHAGYVAALLDGLGIHVAHVVGYSMGGGVALSFADLAPERLRSLTLLSSIGAQPFELLGDYYLNHVVHGMQLAALWALREGTPHFGWLDDAMLGVPYARNFYDSDQRPLTPALSRLSVPTLILHGTRDPLVPYEAALEHRRLVPQSVLRTYDADHFMPFTEPDIVAEPIDAFLADVDAGRAATRASADPERVRAARDGPIVPPPPATGIAGLVMAGALAAATLVSEDLTCLGAGMLVAHGRIGFALASTGCTLGILGGDLLLFLAGRWFGRSSFGRRVLTWLVRPAALERSTQWINGSGTKAVFVSRFVPGTRLPTYVAAGVLSLSPWRFLPYFVVAAVIWTPMLVAAGAAPTAGLARLGVGSSLVTGGLLLAALVAVLRLLPHLTDYRRRRALVGWWTRWTQWEFWPMWLFYPPVVAYLLVLAARHRSLTVFTAVNPGMPGGGFVGESKSDILARIAAMSHVVPEFAVMRGAASVDERRGVADRMVAAHGLPLVVKPDQGQRGAGVTIARTLDALDRAVQATTVDTILQRYVPGDEFGVFYYRFPDQPHGHIFAITEKRLQVVTGDGRRTVEQLILDHPRAVAVAPLYLQLNHARLGEVLPPGEPLRLSELGVHSRGAIFLDGGHARTPALERAVDEVGRAVDGFYFGRFDVRADSLQAFRDGRFAVIELNGVTSEATSLYDPKHSLVDAYRILFAQWRLAFAIGAANRARGVRTATVTDLIGMVRAYRGFAEGHLTSQPSAAARES